MQNCCKNWKNLNLTLINVPNATLLCLTGSLSDVKKIDALGKKYEPIPGLKYFMNRVF